MGEPLDAPGSLSSGPSVRPLPTVLRAYALGVVLLTVAALLFQVWVHRHGPHYYPYDNLLFQDGSNFLDLTGFYSRFRLLHTADFFAAPHTPLRPIFTYPAPVAILYQLFYRLPNPVNFFLGFSCLAYLVATLLFARALRRHGLSPAAACAFAATVLLTSYPAALQCFVANIEVCVWIIVSLGIWAEADDRPWLAAACFGVATSMKLFPFVYFGLLLSRRQLRQLVFGLTTAATTTLLSLWWIGPSIPIANRGIAAGLAWFREAYVWRLNRPESGMDHTLYAMLKLPLIHPHKLGLLFRIATPFLVLEAIFGLLLYVFVIRRLPWINQVTAFTIAAILLPPVSHDYTLLHLYAPFVLFVLWSLTQSPSLCKLSLAVAFSLFALLFTPENWLIVNDMRVAGQLKALALSGLFLLVLLVPFPSTPRSPLVDPV